MYTFDTKDSIDKWKANEGSKIEWQENGADTNSGCLKVAGGHTSVDSPRLKFACADNVISFDYYAHGTSAIRLRLSVASEDHRARYGRFGNLIMRKITQDKWVHVEVKLADVPGMADAGAAKAFPELEYDRFAFISAESVGADGYLLIDNVKLVGPGDVPTPAAVPVAAAAAPASANQKQ